MTACRLCPRNCGIDRMSGKRGFCGVPATVYVARAALHFWEEPCISGSRGSGAVFFTGCGLKCVFCQNAPISGVGSATGPDRSRSEAHEAGAGAGSRKGSGQIPERDSARNKRQLVSVPGKPVTEDHLAEIFLRLQNEQGANNINLVTAVQYIPQVAEALRLAKDQGLSIPVVYNSSGYEKAGALRLLEGLVDVWLPDFKYMDPEMARRYSGAPDYPERAKEAVAEMVRQAGEPEFYAEEPYGGDGRTISPGTYSEAGEGAGKVRTGAGTVSSDCSRYRSGQSLIRRGVIVRHLLMPGHVKNAEAVVRYLHDTYGDSIYISMMNQYTPMKNLKMKAEDYRLLSRKVTKREYERLIDYAVGIGIEKGFIQEGGTAKESFIPAWNGEGV